jgi:hypothetical protein
MEAERWRGAVVGPRLAAGTPSGSTHLSDSIPAARAGGSEMVRVKISGELFFWSEVICWRIGPDLGPPGGDRSVHAVAVPCGGVRFETRRSDDWKVVTARAILRKPNG